MAECYMDLTKGSNTDILNQLTLWKIANIATFCVLFLSKEQKKPREIKLGEDTINRDGTSHSKRAKDLIKLFRINERSLNTNIE